MPDRITVLSPAKLNLILRVLGRRPDGYHDLFMLNAAVDLYDAVTIARAGSGLTVTCDHPGVPTGEANLAGRAAAAFFQAFPEARTGLAISIAKQVPVAGGLGGGSGNAAAVLWGLPRLLGVAAPEARLLELAAEIGSDVPFFLFQSPAWAEGRGEILSAAEGVVPSFFVIVTFPFGISTAEVFRGWDQSQDQLTRPFEDSMVTNRIRTMLPPEAWSNDLEAVAVVRHGEIARARDLLQGAGALRALMSGSGPTVYGVFPDEASAFRARDAILSDCFASVRVGRLLRGAVLKLAS